MQGVANGSPVFQFHKGTIKPVTIRTKEFGTKRFQFHKGTIKPFYQLKQHQHQECFNSIKVRLNRTQE